MIRTHSVRSHMKFAHRVFEQFVPRAVAMSFAVILSSPGVGGGAVDLLPADSSGVLIVADQTGGRKPKGKMRLCVRKVEATDAINERYPGSNSLATLLDALDGQLIQEIQRRRKFEIIADSQLDEVLGTQDRNLGLGADPSAGGVPVVASCQNTLVVRVDDFQDTTVSRKFEGGTVVKARRTLRVGATAQIYREDGSLLEAVDFRKSGAANSSTLPGAGVGTGGGMLAQYAEALAVRVADYTSNFFFPARVIAKSMGQVTINRGQGTDVEVGQIWEVFMQGRVLIDPDTGEELGAEEMSAGWVKIRDVQPKLSRASILLDEGVEEGAVLRFRPEGLPAAVREKISVQEGGRRSRSVAEQFRVASVFPDVEIGFPSPAFAQDGEAGFAPDVGGEEASFEGKKPGPPRLAIFVKNRARQISDDQVMPFEDQVTAAATDRGFRVINREDVINSVSAFANDGANAGGSERLGQELDRQLSDSSSAIALARNLGADLLLLVSIISLQESSQQYRDSDRGIAVQTNKATLRSTYRVTSGVTGETVAAENVAASTSWRNSANLQRSSSGILEQLMADSAEKIGDGLSDRRQQVVDAGEELKDGEVPITVLVSMADLSIPEVVEGEDGELTVTANRYDLEIMSVEVEVDGILVGTASPQGEMFSVAPGLHRLRLHREGFTPVERVISAKPGLMVVVPMRMSPEGYARWKENAELFSDLKEGQRLSESQAAAWEGLGQFLADSHLRVGEAEASAKAPAD
jgi:hypothetical protein